jgi:hypothetical protein
MPVAFDSRVERPRPHGPTNGFEARESHTRPVAGQAFSNGNVTTTLARQLLEPVEHAAEWLVEEADGHAATTFQPGTD